MKKTIFILLTLACSMTGVKAQEAVYAPNTGDTEMNAVLTDVEAKAKADPVGFANDVSTRFNVPKDKVDAASKEMSPGDVFMAGQVSSITKKPFEEVTKTYQANKGKGWGVVAKEMGIKPGSAEFHAMKKSMKSHGNANAKGNDNGNAKGNGNGKGKGKANSGDNGSQGSSGTGNSTSTGNDNAGSKGKGKANSGDNGNSGSTETGTNPKGKGKKK